MTSVQKLYGEFWAGDSALDSAPSQPRTRAARTGSSRLFAELGPKPGQLARRRRRAGRHPRDPPRARARPACGRSSTRCRSMWNCARDAAPKQVSTRSKSSRPAIEDDADRRTRVADWIWCRDVLVHVDARTRLRGMRAHPPSRRADARVRHVRHRLARAARSGRALRRARDRSRERRSRSAIESTCAAPQGLTLDFEDPSSRASGASA